MTKKSPFFNASLVPWILGTNCLCVCVLFFISMSSRSSPPSLPPLLGVIFSGAIITIEVFVALAWSRGHVRGCVAGRCLSGLHLARLLGDNMFSSRQIDWLLFCSMLPSVFVACGKLFKFWVLVRLFLVCFMVAPDSGCALCPVLLFLSCLGVSTPLYSGYHLKPRAFPCS